MGSSLLLRPSTTLVASLKLTIHKGVGWGGGVQGADLGCHSSAQWLVPVVPSLIAGTL